MKQIGQKFKNGDKVIDKDGTVWIVEGYLPIPNRETSYADGTVEKTASQSTEFLWCKRTDENEKQIRKRFHQDDLEFYNEPEN